MATATITATLEGSTIILSSTFEGNTRTERLQYEDEAAAEAALQKMSSIDLESIERQTGATIRMSEVQASDVPA